MRIQDIHSRGLGKSAALSSLQMDNPIAPLAVISTLNRAGVNFVLVGAHGLAGWIGKPRATEDVDVVIMTRHLKKARRALEVAFPHLEARDLGEVIRFRDKQSGAIAIDLLKQRELYRQAFKHTHSISMGGQVYKVPALEMALTMKFAAMISPSREDAARYQDAHDFVRMVQGNPNLEAAKLAELGELVYSGGGEGILEMVRKVQAGEPLNL
jgi:hypothetical protein